MWAALRTMPGAEKRVEACLADLGFAHFCPRVAFRTRSTRRGQKPALRETPLLPTYVFVAIAGEWRPVLAIPSALSFVRGAGDEGPAILSEETIAALRERERQGLTSKAPKIVNGSPVKIVAGPFKDQVAVAEQVGCGYLFVPVFFMGAQRRMRVARALVEPI